MVTNATIAQVAALAGDPTRVAMLQELMDGRALTASELARVAGVTAQTASGHLAQMSGAGLLTVEKQGRHRYHKLASAAVAHMMESIMQVVADRAPPRRRLSIGPRDAAMRAARTCYDHLAGRLGVAITDAMVGNGYLELADDAGLVTVSGIKFLTGVGINTDKLIAQGGKSSGRVLCRPCLDWSERRPHLAGAVGAAICRHCFDAGLVCRIAETRAVAITPKGQRVFRERFGARI